jgi:hypothetical protein
LLADLVGLMGFFLSWASGKDDDGLLGGDTGKKERRVASAGILGKTVFTATPRVSHISLAKLLIWLGCKMKYS